MALPQQEGLEDGVGLALVQVGTLRFQQLVADLETRVEIEGRSFRRRQMRVRRFASTMAFNCRTALAVR